MDHIGSLISDAAVLMMTGMAFVFLFLTLLVFIVTLMAKIIPQEQPASMIPAKKASASPTSMNGTDPKVIAAISAAVKQYRSSDKK